MAVTFSFNWASSPRIITVNLPDTTVTVQQIVDAVRAEEAKDVNLAYPQLIDAVGKTNLGGGLITGIVLTLKNAQLKFADQPGPSTIQCFVNNGTVVKDDGGTPIAVSNFTSVTMNNQVGGVISNAVSDAVLLANNVWSHALTDTGTSYAASKVLCILAAVMAGKLSNAQTNPVFRNLGDTADHVLGTVDKDGNRTAVSYY